MRLPKLNTSNVILSQADRKRAIVIPSKISEELAEFVGIHVADGHMGHYPNQRHYVIQWGGDPKSGKQYYDFFIKQLWRKVFNAEVKPCLMHNGMYGFMFYSKGILRFLETCMGIPCGDKTKTAKIPLIIKNTCRNGVSEQMAACLRGLIDNDFFFSSIGRDHILGAWFASKGLILDLHEYFSRLGIYSKLTLDDWYFDKRWNKYILRHGIRIRRKKDLCLWHRVIGSHNQKIYKKYDAMVNIRKQSG